MKKYESKYYLEDGSIKSNIEEISYRDSPLHRLDGPAVEHHTSTYFEFIVHGSLHNLNRTSSNMERW